MLEGVPCLRLPIALKTISFSFRFAQPAKTDCVDCATLFWVWLSRATTKRSHTKPKGGDLGPANI